MRAWLICPMISPKCAALFPESLAITICNLDKEIWYYTSYAKLLLKIFQNKRSQKSSRSCHFNPTFVINWCFTDFFYQWKSTKICRKAKDDILLHFHVYLDTSKRTITQRTFAPEDFLPRGNFWPRKFSPRRLLSKKDPLCQGHLFIQEDVYLFGTIVQRHLCNKGHPMAKYVVWSRVLTKQKSDTWWLF